MAFSDSAGELKYLQRCMSDLVSVLALPAIWSGQEPRKIVTTFHDAFMAALNLDLLYTHVTLEASGAPIEVLGTAPHYATTQNADKIRQALNERFGDDPRKWPAEVRTLIGGREICLLLTRLGLDAEIGFVVAGSERADFPTQSERLLLGVAANQVTVGLQQARLLSEQKRIANELDRRVAERTRELAETNAELQLQVGVLQHLPLSAWTLKPDGTPDFVNQVWLEFSGQTLDFVRSHPEAWMTAIHPEDRETASRAFWDGVRSGRGFAIETRSLRAQDQTYRWHLQQAVVLRDAEGKVLKFVGTTTDIDDQKRAEEALRASETNLRQIIDSIPGLVCTMSPAGVTELINQTDMEYFGRTFEELKNWTSGDSDAIHPDDLPRVSSEFTHSITTGTHFDTELRLRRADGVYRWFHNSGRPAQDTDGRITRWCFLITDIDDRKRAEEALRESEQRFRLIVDGIAGLVAIMSPAGELEVVNHQVLTYFGKTVEQLKGWSTSNEVHPDDMPAVVSAWTHSVETASAYDIDHRLLRADGVYRWFHARGLPLCDAEGRVLRWYILLTDIDDRKQAEEALARARAELAHVAGVTSLSMLTASIAHEVNQPLSGIITNANTCLRMLSGDQPNIEGARETARRTIRDGHRASEVVTRLRALFKRKEVAAEPIDLNDAAQEVIALSLSELQSNKILVRHEFAENLPTVKGDRIQLQQVILNLLRNASDAMRDVDNRPRQLLIKTGSDDNKNVQLTVQDTGIGFAPDAAGQLFESFYTTKEDGMGIGLSVSRSIIEAHRGQLWATSNDGPGSSFMFSIPCHPGSQQSQNL
jgi:PAS domain S-box-containing protein